MRPPAESTEAHLTLTQGASTPGTHSKSCSLYLKQDNTRLLLVPRREPGSSRGSIKKRAVYKSLGSVHKDFVGRDHESVHETMPYAEQDLPWSCKDPFNKAGSFVVLSGEFVKLKIHLK